MICNISSSIALVYLLINISEYCFFFYFFDNHGGITAVSLFYQFGPNKCNTYTFDFKISTCVSLKDKHQWWGHEFRCSLSLDMDKLFPKALMYI